MTNVQLTNMLKALPGNAKVYFKVPSDDNEGDEMGIATLNYNIITNDIVLGWDCPANYDFDLDEPDAVVSEDADAREYNKAEFGF